MFSERRDGLSKSVIDFGYEAYFSSERGRTLSLLPIVFDESHQDYVLIKRLEAAILRHAGGIDKFKVDIPQLLRRAIDEVIDSARSNRFTLIEIEKTEKTYIGTKIEILLRNHLQMSKGKVLDLSIDGIEVDIKNTIGSNWTIPIEALGHPCILFIRTHRYPRRHLESWQEQGWQADRLEIWLRSGLLATARCTLP
jgi:hypothetical protein